jgi:serine/threonine-protein kinase mTOR
MATPSVSQQTDILNSIFVGLKSKSPETRLQSALDLRRYVCLVSPELSARALNH